MKPFVKAKIPFCSPLPMIHCTVYHVSQLPSWGQSEQVDTYFHVRLPRGATVADIKAEVYAQCRAQPDMDLLLPSQMMLWRQDYVEESFFFDEAYEYSEYENESTAVHGSVYYLTMGPSTSSEATEPEEQEEPEEPDEE